MIEYIFDFKIIVLTLIIYLLYRLGTYRQNLHIKLGSNGPRPFPFVGNMISIGRIGMHEFDRQCRDKYGKIYPSYLGSTPLCMVSDEELLKQILIKDFKSFSDRLDIGLSSKTTKNMLTELRGKDWERVRNLITPTFTSGKLKKMSPLLVACVDLLTKRLHDTAPETNLDMKEFFGALAMDAIARTMFGMEIDSQTNPKNLFMVHAKKLFTASFFNPAIFLIVLFPAAKSIMDKVYPNWEPLGGETMGFFSKNIQKAISERKSSTDVDKYTDFLALMLNAGREEGDGTTVSDSGDGGKYLSGPEIVAQSLIFLIAGYETSAVTMTYVCYFLAKHPSAQQELYDELIQTIGVEGDITYNALMQLSLLDGAINETLRLCPPAPRLDRVCTQDIDLVTSNKQIIHAAKGDVFTVPIYAIHTDPSIWPDPEVFDIHRFDRDAKKDRSLYAHMPFGMGPRNCVGMRFALLEIKWAIATILKDFEILCCEKTPETIKFKPTGFSDPVEPIIVRVQNRQ